MKEQSCMKSSKDNGGKQEQIKHNGFLLILESVIQIKLSNKSIENTIYNFAWSEISESWEIMIRNLFSKFKDWPETTRNHEERKIGRFTFGNWNFLDRFPTKVNPIYGAMAMTMPVASSA